MTATWVTGVAAAAAFMAGSFPTGVIVARARGIDIRKVGSGNIGATNVARALGKKWALFVLLVDALKGYVPTAVVRRFFPEVPASGVALVALAAVVGHMFSIFLKGRGGKGVATTLGAALAIDPLATLIAALVYAALYALFRISSVGSLAAMTSFPIAMAVLGGRPPAFIAFGVVIAILVIARHHENIRRLIRGEEGKV
jgi:acyl phosphate:glycerol-3-phosphate acyltransferase